MVHLGSSWTHQLPAQVYKCLHRLADAAFTALKCLDLDPGSIRLPTDIHLVAGLSSLAELPGLARGRGEKGCGLFALAPFWVWAVPALGS